MGSLRKTFYWYFPKRLHANYLVLILQSWECFFCKFHGRTGNNILQVTGSNIVSSNHFIMQYFFIRPAGPITASSEVRGHIFLYCRIFFFFSSEMQGSAIVWRAEQMVSESSLSQNKRKAIHQAFEERFSFSFQGSYSQRCTFHKAACSC